MKEELSNIDVVLFSLYRLGGINTKVHTEKIAIESFILRPEKFSWRLPEYKTYIDKTPVRFALEAASKKVNGSLVTGKARGDSGRDKEGNVSREGWRLTVNGAEWIKKNEVRIAKLLKQEKPGVQKRDAERFIKRIKSDIAFKQYEKDKGMENVTRYHFSDLLSLPPDVSLDVIQKLYGNLKAEAILVGDKQIMQFLELCQQKFLTNLNQK